MAFLNTKWKDCKSCKSLCTKNFRWRFIKNLSIYLAVDISKIYFLKNAKKTCKPNNRDLNCDLITRNSLISISLLGLLLFIIYCDLFISSDHTHFRSSADNTVPFDCDKNFDQIPSDLKKDLTSISEWFLQTYCKANNKTLHLV